VYQLTTYAQIKGIKNKYVDSIIKKTNVVGVGIGRKIVGGEVTAELCIKVYVESKTAMSRLSPDTIIPATIESIKTDVVEVGRIRFQGLRSKNRPTQGGDSIGSCHSTKYGYIMAGTLGVALIDKTDGKRVLLSNNHVFADLDNDVQTRANAGDPIVQPGTLDGGSCSTDVIGSLKRWIKFRMSNDNEIDAAIASLNNESDALECMVECDIGKVKGYRTLNEDDINLEVQKCGRTTGYTTGTVIDVDASIDVSYETLTPSGPTTQNIRFINQILTTAMSDSGDSGSLILDMNEKAVGLLFAGSTTVTVANRIESVLNILNLELCPIIPPCLRPGPYVRCPSGPIFECMRSGPMRTCPSGPIILCRRGGPVEPCPKGGPNVPLCERGPLMACIRNNPLYGPIQCTAAGPSSPIGCGKGPNKTIDVYGCPGGADSIIHIKDPLIDPAKIVVLDMDKIPQDMRASVEKMIKKMAEEQ
jgi:hypothetical protein